MPKRKDDFHYNNNHSQSMSSMIFFGTPSLTPSASQQLSDHIQQEETWTSEELDVFLNKRADN